MGSARRRKARMIGIEEVQEFVASHESSLSAARKRTKARQFYRLLFWEVMHGRLSLYFVCTECDQKLGTCRCARAGSYMRGNDWLYDTKPLELAARWKLSLDSVLKLPEREVARYQIQTTTRLRNFIEFVRTQKK